MRRDYLVGYTGFVGSNIAASHDFAGRFNSRNIADAFDGRPDLLVYAGVPAEMFIAAHDPKADMQVIEQAEDNILRIGPRNIVLISTIAVYPETHGADEDTQIDASHLSAYGANRYSLEQWVEEQFAHPLVIRLPALYGMNLKKNFLYDYLHMIPARLSEAKLTELSQKAPSLREYYEPEGNGFYRCGTLSTKERQLLRKQFESLGFSALNFTDSRSKYQFFDLSCLWNVIETALEHDLRRLNVTVPPVEISELYHALCGKPFVNALDRRPFDYDLKSKHASLFGGRDGYFCTKEEVLHGIQTFVDAESRSIP